MHKIQQRCTTGRSIEKDPTPEFVLLNEVVQFFKSRPDGSLVWISDLFALWKSENYYSKFECGGPWKFLQKYPGLFHVIGKQVSLKPYTGTLEEQIAVSGSSGGGLERGDVDKQAVFDHAINPKTVLNNFLQQNMRNPRKAGKGAIYSTVEATPPEVGFVCTLRLPHLLPSHGKTAKLEFHAESTESARMAEMSAARAALDHIARLNNADPNTKKKMEKELPQIPGRACSSNSTANSMQEAQTTSLKATEKSKKCPNGHELQWYINDYGGSNACDSCQRVMQPPEPFFRCKDCDFDHCQSCYHGQLPQATKTCPSGHLLLHHEIWLSSEGHFCNRCHRHGISSPEHVFRCENCDFDLCAECYEWYDVGDKAQQEEYFGNTTQAAQAEPDTNSMIATRVEGYLDRFERAFPRQALPKQLPGCADTLVAPELAPDANVQDNFADVLAYYAKGFALKRVHKTTLGAQPSETDMDVLTGLFEEYIGKHGFLTADFVIGELLSVCEVRRTDRSVLVEDGKVGALFKGILRMLFVVDATLEIAFSVWPIVTIRELEQTVMGTNAFEGKANFKQACLGDLQHHPEVMRRFRFLDRKLPAFLIPVDFPDLSTSDLIRSLTENLMHNPAGWDLQCALDEVSKEKGFKDYREMGVFVQHKGFVQFLFNMTQHSVREQRKTIEAHVCAVLRRMDKHALVSCLDWDFWRCLFQSLRTIPDAGGQLQFVQSLVAQDFGVDVAAHAEHLSQQDANVFVRSVVAPLVLMSAQAAQFGAGLDVRKAATSMVSLKRFLMNEGEDWIKTIKQELDKYPLREPSLSLVLQGAELNLIQFCGLDYASELPWSLAHLLATIPRLQRLFEIAVARGTAVPSPTREMHEENDVANHFLQLVSAACSNSGSCVEGSQKRQTFQDLLGVLGRCEGELCRARHVRHFGELGLPMCFGAFMDKHAVDILQEAGTMGMSSLEQRLLAFCTRLQLPCNGDEKRIESHARAHFSDVADEDEIKGAVCAALKYSSLNGSDMPTMLGPPPLQALLANAGFQPSQLGDTDVEPIPKLLTKLKELLPLVPPLVNIADVFPHEEFANVGLATALSMLPDGEFKIVEVQSGCFVRLPETGSHGDFMCALQTGDPWTTAGIALAALLEGGAETPIEQFQTSAMLQYREWEEDQHSGVLLPGSLETFVLVVVTAAPLVVRKLLAEILVRPYIQLHLSLAALSNVAASAPKLTAAAHWIGRNFGIPEWSDISWATSYPAFAFSRATQGVTVAERTDDSVLDPKSHGQTLTPETVDGAKDLSNDIAVTSLQVDPDSGRLEGNETLCTEIARLKAVDLACVDPITRCWTQAPTDDAILSLQRTVQGAIRRLTDDLYSGDAHALLELLQNMDDCQFGENVEPALTLHLDQEPHSFATWTTFASHTKPQALLIFEHNEVGFQAENVRALCDIDKSTKSAQDGKYIGAKGIGFKSVFGITPTPIVHSRGHHFHFDKNSLNGLGSLLPFPLPVPMGFDIWIGTRIVLPLFHQHHVKQTSIRLTEELKPTLLLFLRKLKCLIIQDRLTGTKRQINKAVEDQVATLTTTTLSLDVNTGKAGTEANHVQESVQSWLVYTRLLNTPASNAVTELKFAFQITGVSHPEEKAEDIANAEQQVFAWLPLRSYGFRFIVQADWIVPLSREAISCTDAFNQAIRGEMPQAFAEAVALFVARARKAARFQIAESLDAMQNHFDDAASCSDKGEEVLPLCGSHEENGCETMVDCGGSECKITSMYSNECDLKAARAVLRDLYAVIPLPGETSEFFECTPSLILNALQGVRCVLVRRFIGRRGMHSERLIDDSCEDKPGAGPNLEASFVTPKTSDRNLQKCSASESGEFSSNLMAATTSTYALGFAFPSEAVRGEVPQSVSFEEADAMLIRIEPLLNSGGLYFEVGGLSEKVASKIGVTSLNARGAMVCLEQLAQRESATPEGQHSDETFEMIRFLLLLAAHDEQPPRNLRELRILPTNDGRLSAVATSHIYDVDDSLAAAMPRMHALDPRFRAKLHPAAHSLLQRIGLEQTRGLQFLKQILIPALTQNAPPECRELVECTRATKYLLSLLGQVEREPMLHILKSNMWIQVRIESHSVASTSAECSETRLIRLGRGVTVHMTPLPEVLLNACKLDWVCLDAGAYADSKHDLNSCSEWSEFWRSIGAWPAVGLEEEHGSEFVGGVDYTSPDLDAILDAISAGSSCQEVTDRAIALVHMLVESGAEYEAYLSRKDQQLTTFASSLVSRPWLPTYSGGVLPPSRGWLAEPSHNTKAKKPSPLEMPCVFLKCVKGLIDSWPVLQLQSGPSLDAIVQVLRSMKAADASPCFAVAHLVDLYARLADLLPTGWNEREESSANYRFLMHEAWIFVPNHPPLQDGPHGSFRTGFDDKGTWVKFHGAFYAPSDLVYKDPINLLDSYARSVSDGACDLARRAARTRVVANYYWSEKTHFFPGFISSRTGLKRCDQVHQFTREQKVVQQLFTDAGVRSCASWKEYVKILQEVNCLTERTTSVSSNETEDVLCVVDKIIAYLCTEVHAEIRDMKDFDLETEGQMGDLDEANTCGNPVCIPLENEEACRRIAPMHRSSETLRSFVNATSELRFVPTKSGTWEPLRRTLFIENSETRDWSDIEACRLVVSPSMSRHANDVAGGWELCGLLQPGGSNLAQRACLLPAMDNTAAAVVKSIFLAALRAGCQELHQATLCFTDLFWQVASKVEFVQAEMPLPPAIVKAHNSYIAVQDVVLVDANDVKTAGLPTLPAFGDHGAIELLMPASENFSDVTQLVQVVVTRETYPAHVFVGFHGNARSDSLVVAFHGEAVHFLIRPQVVGHLIEMFMSVAVSKMRETCEPALGTYAKPLTQHTIDSLKRAILKWVQQLVQQVELPLSAASSLEDFFDVVDAASQHLGDTSDKTLWDLKAAVCQSGKDSASPPAQNPRRRYPWHEIMDSDNDASLMADHDKHLCRHDASNGDIADNMMESALGALLGRQKVRTNVGTFLPSGLGDDGLQSKQCGIRGAEELEFVECARQHDGNSLAPYLQVPSSGTTTSKSSALQQSQACAASKFDDDELRSDNMSSTKVASDPSTVAPRVNPPLSSKVEKQEDNADPARALRSENDAPTVSPPTRNRGASEPPNVRPVIRTCESKKTPQHFSEGVASSGHCSISEALQGVAHNAARLAACRLQEQLRREAKGGEEYDGTLSDNELFANIQILEHQLVQALSQECAAIFQGMGHTDVHEVLQRVYAENDSPEFFFCDAAGQTQYRCLKVVRKVVPVDDVFYIHAKIPGTFGSGEHQGQSIWSLVTDLDDGHLDPMLDPRLLLKVARYGGKLHSLNNRRLHALKIHQEHVRSAKVIRIQVAEYELDKMTAEFAGSFTTVNGGMQVSVDPEFLQ